MIKKATINDIDIINELGNKFKKNFSVTYDVSNYLENDNYIILLNEKEYVNAFMIVYKNIDFYELEAIYVSKKCRKCGIASAMLNDFFDSLNKDDEILLEVATNNLNALKLYEKFGFKIINIRKKYYDGIDAYVMKKVI